MKKIAILVPTFSSFSGMDRLAKNKAEELLTQGNKVTIFTFRSDMKVKGAKVIDFGMPKSLILEKVYRLFFFLMWKKIKYYTNLLKDYDKVICYFYPMTIIATAAKRKYGLKYIYYNSGVADAKYFDTLLEKVYIWMFKKFSYYYAIHADHADEIIHISQAAKEEFMKNRKISELNVKQYVEYPKLREVKVKRFKENQIKKLKKEMNLDFPVYLYVGRLSPHKGIKLLIHAFSNVEKLYPSARLIIVGKATVPGYLEKLKKISSSERVIFKGYVDDDELPKYYNVADVYVNGSEWENYDIPAVAAQEMKKSIVASDIAVHKELLKKKVILVPPGNITEFAKAMCAQISN